MATKPTFIEVNAQQIVTEMVTYYETATGKKLQPAQVEMLLINMFAYREALIRSAIQETACQNLVEFAEAPVLDLLANLVGLSRTPELAAECTIRFSLVSGHNGVTIPIGLRTQTEDGKVVFQTVETKTAAVGITYLHVKAKCQNLGIIGNGYVANKVKAILDPLPFISAAGNLATTSGGADTETDEALRGRIKAAPGRFSNAGPQDAYVYFAKNAHPDITDVTVLSNSGGHVDIYPLTDAESTPTDVLSAVTAACNAESVRPLTDIVSVYDPTRLLYYVDIELTLLSTAIGDDVTDTIQAALDQYALTHRTKLGKDVIKSALIALCMIPGVYNTNVVLWRIDGPEDWVEVDIIEVNNTECAIMDGSEITIEGTEDE